MEPDKFKLLYTCRIGLTGEKVYKTPALRNDNSPLTDIEKMVYQVENEIAIKMPESEYHRFVENWNNYLTIMQVAGYNPIIKEQYTQLLILANLVK